jgi:CRP/FNR family cyclic AMP-dependent transcriptional regulator
MFQRGKNETIVKLGTRYRLPEGGAMTISRVQLALLLKEQALFALASDDVINRASEAARILEFSAGDYICFQGDAVSPLVLVISGQLRTFILSEDGREVPVRVINSGQSGGEASILQNSSLQANMVAVRKSTVALLSRPYARQLLNEPDVARALNNAMATLLSHLVKRHAVQGLSRADARISAVIESAIEDSEKDESPLIELPDQSAIAAMAKVSRETVSRVLKSLEHRGTIAKEGRRIRILDRNTLRTLAAR